MPTLFGCVPDKCRAKRCIKENLRTYQSSMHACVHVSLRMQQCFRVCRLSKKNPTHPPVPCRGLPDWLGDIFLMSFAYEFAKVMHQCS